MSDEQITLNGDSLTRDLRPSAVSAVREIANILTDPAQRRALAKLVAAGPNQIACGEGGYRRTPINVSHDLWGPDEAMDLWPEPDAAADGKPKILSNGMLEYDGRLWSEVGFEPRERILAIRDEALNKALEYAARNLPKDVQAWLAVAHDAGEQLRREDRIAAARIIAMHLANM